MSEERLEGRIVALRSLCVILLDRHCRDRRIDPKDVTSSSGRLASKEEAEGYDLELKEVLDQLNALRGEEPYRTG